MRNIDWLSDKSLIKAEPKLIFLGCWNEKQTPLLVKFFRLFKSTF